MIQADMHMHTWFSTDSEACPCDMADEAVRKSHALGHQLEALFGELLPDLLDLGRRYL